MKIRRSVWIILGTLPAIAGPVAAAPAAIATAVVEASGTSSTRDFDAVVEADRQTTLSARIPGTITHIQVRPGDHVKAGQVLLRLDARSVVQSADAGQAQADAAQAGYDVARRDFERQQHLFDKGYISQSAFDRAQARFRQSEAQWHASQAQAGAALTTAQYETITAPFAGVIAAVPANVGDLAAPGTGLVTLYDPAGLRVTAHIPQGQLSGSAPKAEIEVVQGGTPTRINPRQAQVLPAADAVTHTVELRLALPSGTGLVPGTFARVWLGTLADAAASASAQQHLFVPTASVFTRTEMSGVYVVDDSGRPLLRQVRIGLNNAGRTEILSGVTAGEHVALDPQAAAIAH